MSSRLEDRNNPNHNRQQMLIAGLTEKFLQHTVGVHKHQLGNPYFVTYYHRAPSSTSDPNLGMTYSEVGPNSPVKYAKIKDMPLFKFEGTFTALELGDLGPEDTYEGKAVVLPMAFKPEIGDRFAIEVLSTRYLFEVTEANPDRLHNEDTYYDLTFEFSSDTITEIEQQVVVEPRILPDKNFQGTGALLEESNAVRVEVLESFYELLFDVLETFIAQFMIPVPPNYTHKGKRPVVAELAIMIRQNGLSYLKHRFNKQHLLVMPWFESSRVNYLQAYYNSVFGFFDRPYTTHEGFSTETCPNYIHAKNVLNDPYATAQGIYRGSQIPFKLMITTNEMNVDSTWNMIPEQFITTVNANNTYDDDNHILEDILCKYKSVGHNVMSDFIVSKYENLERSIYNRDDSDLLVYVPLVMTAVKKAIAWHRSQIVNYIPE